METETLVVKSPRASGAPGAAEPGLPVETETPARSGRWWVWLLVWAVIGVGAYFLWPKLHGMLAARSTEQAAGKGGKKGDRAMPVVTTVARKGNLDLYITGLGTASALNTVTVRSRVDGQLNKVAFEEGQLVKEGQLLAEVDPRPFEVQLTQAQGQLAKDEALLKNAKLDLERYQSIRESITQQQIDTQQSQVGQFEGAVKIDQGHIDEAKLQLSYCTITAPISGRIGLRLVDQGNMIHQNDPGGLAVITQLQPIAVVFTIPQDDIPQVMKRMSSGDAPVVEAYDRDMRTKLATGTLSAVDNQVDPNTGTVRLKATFPNDDGMLFPNQFVNARLLVDTRRDVVLVPAAGVQHGPDYTFAYVVKPDETVELRRVELGPTEGEVCAIESGLSPGEVVVTDGVDKLTPGAKVSARTGGTTRPAGAAASRPAGEGMSSTRPVGAGGPPGAGKGNRKGAKR